jgi:hypothetical protein
MASNHRARGSEEFGIFDDAKTYYASDERHHNRYGPRTRTYSQNSLLKQFERVGLREPFRRGSHGRSIHGPRVGITFFLLKPALQMKLPWSRTAVS